MKSGVAVVQDTINAKSRTLAKYCIMTDGEVLRPITKKRTGQTCVYTEMLDDTPVDCTWNWI